MSLNIVLRPGGWRGIVGGRGGRAAALTQRAQSCLVLQLKEQERLEKLVVSLFAFPTPEAAVGAVSTLPLLLLFPGNGWSLEGGGPVCFCKNSLRRGAYSLFGSRPLCV